MTRVLLQVQEVLCRPGNVERFFPDSASRASAVRGAFASIVSLEHLNDSFRQSVISNPDVWVLKPQREGGASNLFGTSIADAFANWDLSVLQQYVLMERLRSPSFDTVMLRNGQTSEAKVLLHAALSRAAHCACRASVKSAFTARCCAMQRARSF
jgi:glutathione synthase